MKSGLQTLHEIDTAIARARKAVSDASALPKRAAENLVDLRRQQTQAYDSIAQKRLELLETGSGGELGYIDRKAEKLIAEHESAEASHGKKLDKAVVKIEVLEKERRAAEKKVESAVDAYDKAVAKAEKEILKDMGYMAALDRVETSESMVIRASEKLDLAKAGEKEKGRPYRSDPFFNYLHKRRFGTRDAKGWFLTKTLDRWVARISGYRKAAENYRRLTDIPKRLQNHVTSLESNVMENRAELEKLEADILEKKGVTALHKTSLKVQKDLEAIDEKIAGSERDYEELRTEHQRLSGGQTGPYREAVDILSDALRRVKFSDLKRLAAQTTSRDDDNAIEDILELARAADALEDDQKEARKLIKKYERSLKELEDIRRKFKSRRYDAPSSVFDNELVGALLIRVLAGALDGDSLWRQIERAQRTTRRYSDNDFGGIDWTEGLRLPRTSRRSRSPRIRTSIPRSPRISLPRSSGRSKGGFKTIGRF